MRIFPGVVFVIVIMALLASACGDTTATPSPESQAIAAATATTEPTATPQPTNTPVPTTTVPPTSTPTPPVTTTPPTTTRTASTTTAARSQTTAANQTGSQKTTAAAKTTVAAQTTTRAAITQTATTTKPTTTQAAAAGVAAGPDAEEQLFLQLLNEFRATKGQKPLAFDATLFKAARWMAQDMATKNNISHTDSTGRTRAQRFKDFGITARYGGENIAAGLELAKDNLKIWQSDDEHLNNLIGPNYTKAGIGRYYLKTSLNRWHWVLDLG